MPMSRILPIAIIVGIGVLAVIGWVAYRAYNAGAAETQLEQTQQQLNIERQVRKRHAKIDSETPFNGSKSDAVEWLRKYTSPSQ